MTTPQPSVREKVMEIIEDVKWVETSLSAEDATKMIFFYFGQELESLEREMEHGIPQPENWLGRTNEERRAFLKGARTAVKMIKSLRNNLKK